MIATLRTVGIKYLINCLCFGFLIFAYLPASASSDSDRKRHATTHISSLTEIVELVDNLGKALSSLSEGIENVIGTVTRTGDDISSRLEKGRLIRISGRLRVLEAEQIILSGELQEYLERQTVPKWDRIHRHAAEIYNELREMLEWLSQLQSSFVVEVPEAYSGLLATTGQRGIIMSQLERIHTPTSEDDLKQVGLLRERLDVEIKKLRAANDSLSKYISVRYN
jgi:hypothetical protein